MVMPVTPALRRRADVGDAGLDRPAAVLDEQRGDPVGRVGRQ
jgi:hypothetical protein